MNEFTEFTGFTADDCAICGGLSCTVEGTHNISSGGFTNTANGTNSAVGEAGKVEVNNE